MQAAASRAEPRILVVFFLGRGGGGVGFRVEGLGFRV